MSGTETRESEAVAEARREMEICNACRYCEGYCAVFPAMNLRREFTEGDLTYLANLCHGCKGCYYACQYAPPHEFGVNLPKAFADLRAESYERFAWPAPMARLFERNGTVVSVVTALVLTLVVALAGLLVAPEALFAADSSTGAFFRVVPWWLMTTLATLSFGFALVAIGVGTLRFWRATGGGGATPGPAARATADVLTLRNLGGGGHGCNDRDEGFSQTRRWLHHAMFYGFLLCFAATTTGAVYHHVLGRFSPHPFWSLPVQLGTWGGVLLCLGTGGLVWLKVLSDPAPVSKRLLGAEYALLILLFLVSASGLLLLALRHTGAMGLLLAFHLGLVLSLFLLLPYSKFVHGFYRAAALLRNAVEQKAARHAP